MSHGMYRPNMIGMKYDMHVRWYMVHGVMLWFAYDKEQESEGTKKDRRCECGALWRIGRVDAFRPESCGFESRSSRHVGILGKSFTYSCLYSASACKLRHSVNSYGREHF